MKKATGLFCILLILCLAAGALAAPGDAVLFTEAQRTQLGIQMYSNPAMAAVGDTVYTLWGADIYAWQAGQENPVKVASGLEPGYYSNYEDAVAQVGDKADTLIANLTSDGTTLYGLNRLNGKLFPLTFQDEKAVLGTPVQLDWSKMEDKQDTYTYVRDAYRLCIMGNKLFAMIRNNEDYYKPEFAAFDLASGAKQIFDAPFVQDMAPYKDGKLLVRVYDMEKAYQEGQKEPAKPTLAVFDPADGSLTEAGPFGDAYVFGMAYQPETDTLFYTTNSKLMAMKALGAATQAAFMPVDYADESPAVMLPGGLYAINTWSGLLVRNTDPQYLPTSTLAVYNGYMDAATMSFSLEYPQVPVTFNTNVYFEDAQALAQAMVSGDNSFDIYNFDISYQDFIGLMEKGYCMDLSGSPELSAELAKMYPFLQSAVGQDGKFYAMPTMMYGNGLSISPKVWEENGLTDKLPGSFLELIDFMNWWVDEGQNQYPNVQLMQGIGDYGEAMFQMALDLYVHQSQAKNEELSFDTPLFRKVMEALEGMKTKELNEMLQSQTDMGGMPSSRAAIIAMKRAGAGGGMGDALFMNYGDWLNVQGGLSSLQYSKPLILPLEEGETVHIPVYVQGLFINPNTKNPEMALKYVENALKHMDPAQHIMMFPDDNEPVPMPNFEQTVQQWNDELEKAKKRLETAKPEEKKDIETLVQSYEDLVANKDLYYWQVAEENITQYREVAPLCYVAMPNVLDYRAKDGTSEIMTLVDRYRQKQMSLDQFIQEVDQKIRMITLERQ